MSPAAVGTKRCSAQQQSRSSAARQAKKSATPAAVAVGCRVVEDGFVAMPGTVCWARHESKAFTRAVVKQLLLDGQVRVESEDPSCKGEWTCDAKDLLPRSETRTCVANMDDLPDLNMAEVLANVEELYCRSQHPRPGSGWSSIYSSVGPVLIAMNPFKQLPLYGEEWVRAYRQAGNTGGMEWIWRKLGPHCYGTVEQAFQGLRKQVHQSVIICGESGAGKTETNRMMLEYLLDAEAFNSREIASESEAFAMPLGASGKPLTSSSKAVLKRMISEANSLQESFGNAKTVRNDNSSRFGKYSQLHFDGKSLGVRGFEIEHYLLERSRVVSTPEGERNYHIFFQLLRSHRAAEFQLDQGPEAFRYARQGADAVKTDGSSFKDGDDFDSVTRSMELAGFTAEEQRLAFQTVAAVLHLGNVDFEGGQDQCRVAAATRQSLEIACQLLGVPASGPDGLETALIRMRTSAFYKNLGEQDARAQRDVVAKTIYARLFDWLVARLNERLMVWHGERRATIGLLDIFGFEDMPVNGFEQMLINLTNEHMQYLFNAVMFERELEAYRKDGVELPCEQGESNMPCIELFETPRGGIVSLLADLCKAPGEDATKDRAFVALLNKTMKGRPHYEVIEPQDMKDIMASRRHKWGNKASMMEYSECFQVRHYAGDVVYTVRDFVVKSKDYLPTHLAEVLQKASKADVARMLGSVGESSSKDTIPEKFVKHLQVLCRRLDMGSNLFTRCIKPNPNSIPGIVDRPMVLEQLVCGGVVAALEVRRRGFPDRMEFREFCDEFWILELGWRSMKQSVDARQHCEDLLNNFLGRDGQYAFGHTKVFMRTGVLAHMRASVAMRLLRYARTIQRRWRIRKGSEALHAVQEAVTELSSLRKEAEGGRFANYRPVATAFGLAEAVLHDLESHMARVGEESGELSPRTVARKVGRSLYARYSKNIARLRELVVAASEEVNRAAAKREHLEQLFAARMQAKKQEASALLVRVEALEAECSDTRDGEGPEEQAASIEACQKARERLERLMREDLQQFEQEQLATLNLDSAGSGDQTAESDPFPKMAGLLEEVQTLVDTAVIQVEALVAARQKFEEEAAAARSMLEQARQRLEEAAMEVRECQEDEEDSCDSSLEEALAAAWQLESNASSIMRGAKDMDAFQGSVEALLGAVTSLEAAAKVAMKEKKAKTAERQLQSARKTREAKLLAAKDVAEEVLAELRSAPAVYGAAATFLAALRTAKQELNDPNSSHSSLREDRACLEADLGQLEEFVETVLRLSPRPAPEGASTSRSWYSTPRGEDKYDEDGKVSTKRDCVSCTVQ